MKDTLDAVLLAATVTAVVLLARTRGRLGLAPRDASAPEDLYDLGRREAGDKGRLLRGSLGG